MQFITVQKYIHTSPRKLQLVAGMVKKLSPNEAVAILPHVGKRAALPFMKAVETAIANAKQQGVDQSNLLFKEIQINQGPKMKRFRAGARGRAKPYVHVMSHIRIVLETKPEIKVKAADKGKTEKVRKAEKPESTEKVSAASVIKRLSGARKVKKGDK